MALTCTEPGLIAVLPGSLAQLSAFQKQMLKILFLYHQKNTGTVGQDVPVATLLSQAKCFTCQADGHLDAELVWIQRQTAIDAGAVEGTFSASSSLARVKGLASRSMHEMKAIEVLLRCQLS